MTVTDWRIPFSFDNRCILEFLRDGFFSPHNVKLDKVPSRERIPPNQRDRLFLKSTKYVALTLEMATVCRICYNIEKIQSHII